MWIFRFLTVIETKLITGGDPRGSEALLCCPTDYSTQVVFINIRLLCLLFEHILHPQILFWFYATNLPLRVTKDMTLEGYNIPRDSFALANLTGFMQVPNILVRLP